MTCTRCGTHWPVVRGIPRFYQAPNYYWGEIDRRQASRLVADVRQRPWQSAVRACFETMQMQDYCLDLQRASWLALLGLPSTAIALDIGCGYGAITHSMALSLGQVYAIEAVPERIEFTHERLRQEKIANVTLLQASATALPFFENSFDLIAVNGILEWVGEWDLEGSPREAQLRFLGALRRLLKQGGILILGIENRFGRSALLGKLDHSGRAFTSIVPRWLATATLRRAGKTSRYVLSAPGSTREYRTYTYSASGYRKILKEAGFEAISLYWAKPGYNQPRRLIPFESVPLQADDLDGWEERNGSSKRPLLSGRAKALLGGLYPWFADSFVIAAFKNADRQTALDVWLRKTLAREAQGERGSFSGQAGLSYAAYTPKGRQKTVLHFWSPEAGRIRAVAKVNVRKVTGRLGDVELEFRNLTRVREKLLQHPEIGASVPRPLGCRREGNNVYALMSYAGGRAFGRIASPERYGGKLGVLREDLTRLVELGARLSQLLQSVEGAPSVDSGWYQLPEAIASDRALSGRVRRLRYFCDSGPTGKPSWIQHGDFVLGNIFFDEKSGRFEIIDWDDLAGGLPPLYDLFSLIVQGALARFAGPGDRSQPWLEARFNSFADLFIKKVGLAMHVSELLSRACQRLGLDGARLPSLLVEFLLIRIHYDSARGEQEASSTNARMLRAYCENALP